METSNQLTITIEKISMAEIMDISKAFAESGMFPDISKAAQAMVKIQAGQEIGIPPFQAMNGIHIIKGKTTLGAGIIASRVKGSGKYDYTVIQLDDKACSLDFYQGEKKLGNSLFTIEDAKKAQTQNLEKFPKNMLFARAISNGVKWFCADVFSGPVYVPEERHLIEAEAQQETVDTVWTEEPTEEEINALDVINQSTTLEELQKNWMVISKEQRKLTNILSRKEQLKAELQNASI